MFEKPKQPIAIVGVSALFPGSIDKTGFWHDIVGGRDLIREVPPSHWLIDDYFDEDQKALDKTYAKRGGFLGDVEFDSIGFGMPPNIAPSTDTAQMLALIVAEQVLTDASRSSEIDRDHTSVILGVSSQGLLHLMASRTSRPLWAEGMRRAGIPEDEVQRACNQIADLHPEWTESTFPGLLGNVVAGRIANRFDLHGTNCVTDAACASTFAALSMAVNELHQGDSNLVITGGVDTLNDISMYMCFSKTPALSPSGDIRPFSDQADGTMLGEGVGMFALKRLADAEQNDDPIYAVLNGVGTSSDGRAKSIYAPVSSGQTRAVTNAYDKAGYGPRTVELVEAHGTGTIVGDAAEFEGLRSAFATEQDGGGWCALGSVKSQIGHAKAAAGAAGLFKMVMALNHKVLPPTIKIDSPNAKLRLDEAPFYLNTYARPWVRGRDHERRGSVSSFGFGGSNFHVTLSEYVGDSVRAKRVRTLDREMVVLCADDGASLALLARDHASKATEPGYLTFLAQSSQSSYQAGAGARMALVAADESDLAAKLLQGAERIHAAPSTPFAAPNGNHYGVGTSKGDVAFLFPGQGSQYLGMGSGVAMAFDKALAVWDFAADLEWDDRSLSDVVFPQPTFTDQDQAASQELLQATQWAQPAIGAMSLSLLKLLTDMGVRPAHVGGHSFGEFTALHAAGVLSAEDLPRVARRRGELMVQAAQTPGSMIAVSASIDAVRSLLAATDAEVVVANHNAPSQVVLSGQTSQIESVERFLAGNGVAFERLPVATAFHSPLVTGAASELKKYLADVAFSDPQIPVYSNQNAEPYPITGTDARNVLNDHLANPVRFVEMIEAMYAAGARDFIEVGPGSVLTGLTDKILTDRDHRAVGLDHKSKPGLAGFFDGIARLAANGIGLDFAPLWADYDQVEDPHERVKPKLSLVINGTNYQTPYPPADLSTLARPNPSRMDPGTSEHEPIAAEEAPVMNHESATPISNREMDQAPDLPSEATVAAHRSFESKPHSMDATPPTTPQTDRPRVERQPDGPGVDRFQTETAAVHRDVMNAMASLHDTYLRSLESGLAATGDSARALGSSADSAFPMEFPAPIPVTQVPGVAPTQGPQESYRAPSTPPEMTPPPVQPPEILPLVAADAATASAATSSGSLSTAGMREVLLATVSKETGYPVEMLTMDMELEADLGVDSIKRVEILSAMQDQIPDLPQVDTDVMSKLQTMAEIVDYMNSSAGLDSEMGAASAATASAATSSGSLSTAGMREVLLATVSKETGYPVEMLTMDMELEADLGVDSIKRVEILSAMQDQIPDLPQVDTDVMSKLQTMAEIVDYMNSSAGLDSEMGAASAATASAATSSGSLSTAGMREVLLATVSKETGYPVEMLTMDMELEADLGVDSIKRVEILSAMQDQIPDLPQVDTDVMSKLQTMAEIVDYMNSSAGLDSEMGAASAATASAATSSGSLSTAGMREVLLATVSKETGYPVEMLTMDMELEADLGVDSIKRVEILSAMQDQIPDLPQVDTDVMSKLQTMAEIVDYMNSSAGLDSEMGAASARSASADLATEVGAASGPQLSRYVLELIAAPAAGRGFTDLSELRLGVVDAGSGFGSALVSALNDLGANARLIDSAAAGGFGGVVFLGLRDFPSTDNAMALNKEAFAAAKALAAGSDGHGEAFVSVQDTGGDFGMGPFHASRAWSAGLSALTRTYGLERNGAAVKAIDIERAGRNTKSIAEAIATELIQGGPEREVGLAADGSRTTLRSVKTEGTTGSLSLNENDVVVVSGGGHGIVAATMIGLAEATKATFVLLGRTELQPEPAECLDITDVAELQRVQFEAAAQRGEQLTPIDLRGRVGSVLAVREIEETLAAIAAGGGRARYVTADVTDADAVRAALEDVRVTVGPVTALVHGAGVLADKLLVDKTREQFDLVFDTKVGGLEVLLDATREDDLKMMLLFSSVAARAGNSGQADYAMANEVLNKVAVAESRRRPGAVVKSLGWGPWEAGMVSPTLKAHFESLGIPLIPLDAGTQMLVDEAAGIPGREVELVLGGGVTLGAPAQTTKEPEPGREITLEMRTGTPRATGV